MSNTTLLLSHDLVQGDIVTALLRHWKTEKFNLKEMGRSFLAAPTCTHLGMRQDAWWKSRDKISG